jgi:hypothetical protein
MYTLFLCALTGLLLSPDTRSEPPKTPKTPTTSSSPASLTATSSEASTVTTHVEHTSLIANINQTLNRLQSLAPDVKISYRDGQINPSLILRMKLPLEGDTAQARAESFLRTYGHLWQGLTVKVVEVATRRGRAIIHLRGFIEGLEILNQDAKLSIDAQGQAIHLSNGLGAISRVHKAQIDKEQATKVALSTLGASAGGGAKLIRSGFITRGSEAFEIFEVEVSRAPLEPFWVVRVNGVDGHVLSVNNRVRR